MKLQDEMLIEVVGGSISATFLNSLSRLFSTVIEVGRMVGSSLRRIVTKNYCN